MEMITQGDWLGFFMDPFPSAKIDVIWDLEFVQCLEKPREAGGTFRKEIHLLKGRWKTAEAIALRYLQWRGRDRGGREARGKVQVRPCSPKPAVWSRKSRTRKGVWVHSPSAKHQATVPTRHIALLCFCPSGKDSPLLKGWLGQHKSWPAEASCLCWGGPFARKDPHLQIRLPQSSGWVTQLPCLISD